MIALLLFIDDCGEVFNFAAAWLCVEREDRQPKGTSSETGEITVGPTHLCGPEPAVACQEKKHPWFSEE